MTVEKDLMGRVAIVTGAARNLGRAISVALGRRGASVLAHYNSAESAIDAAKTVELVQAAGGQAQAVQADFTDPAAVERLTGEAKRRLGRLDVLVNNAGLIVKKPFADINDADFARAFAVNARAPFQLMRAACAHMADGGRIVNIGTSILACSFPFYSIYAASKAALEHMTRGLSKELGARAITVNTIAPGALDTPFFYAAETAESVAQIKEFTGGLGRVEDVTGLVDYLVSPAARWLTGQTVFINGGFVTR
jgi:NAD(P)-dependent dehydrogenase (short-subunit alcohol dehydrogenase family)